MNEAQRDEFLRQISAYQDGGLSENELTQFDRQLRDDEEKRVLFIMVQRHSVALAEIFREKTIVPNSRAVVPPSRKRRHHGYVIVAFAAAACLALFLLFTPDQATAPVDYATLTFAEQTHWKGASPISGSHLEHGVSYELDSGAIRLRMKGGGIVSIAAPASFAIVDDVTLQLVSGKLAARLPDNDSELRVRAGDLEIRDLGTAFGVTATERGEVDLAVFDGSVAVSTSDAISNDHEETLIAGKAISTSGGSAVREEVPFDSGIYRDIWPLTIGVDDASSIVDFVPPGPSIPLKLLADDHRLFLIPERLNHRVEKPITIDLVGPGQMWPTSQPSARTIDRKRVVSSYLLVYEPENAPTYDFRSLSGRISFQHPILGIAVADAQLRRTDSVFGVSSINYGSFVNRHLEDRTTGKGELPPDSLRISDDGRQLYFSLNVGVCTDHIRVLVDETADHASERFAQRRVGRSRGNHR